MFTKTIEELIRGRPVPQVSPETTVRAACRHLEKRKVGAATVLERGRLVGIFSQRDVIRKCICDGRRTDETRVAEVMTPEPQTIGLDAAVAEALELMQEGGFRHLPVMMHGTVVGLLSMQDIPIENRLLVERFREYTEMHAALRTTVRRPDGSGARSGSPGAFPTP